MEDLIVAGLGQESRFVWLDESAKSRAAYARPFAEAQMVNTL